MKRLKIESKLARAQVWQILKSYKLVLVLAFFLTLLPTYFYVWSPYLIGRLIDDGLMARNERVIWILAFAYLFAQAAHFFTRSFMQYCLSRFGFQVLVDYRRSLLGRILKYPMKFFDKISSGRLTTRLTSDINSLQEMFSTSLVGLIENALFIGGVMMAMLLINWELALVAFLSLPFLFGVTKFFHSRIRRRFGLMRKALSNLNSFASESFSGNRDIHVFGGLTQNQKEFHRYSQKYKDLQHRAFLEFAYFGPFISFGSSLMMFFILIYGGFKIVHGQMPVGELVAFLAYATYFEWPVRNFSEKFAMVQQAMASVDRLVEVSSHPLEKDEGTKLLPQNLSIEFKNVQFRYGTTEDFALNDVSFFVNAGEKIALLGETGSGKTTTCALLQRFYELTEGSLLLGGLDIKSISVDDLRSQVGWVSQEVTLFSTNLRENLRFYDERITDEELWKILELVQLKPWAEKLKSGLYEKFSERAAGLSSGQRQLISLARALLIKPRILILDEATAYVDSQTEWKLQQAMEKLWDLEDFKGMTGFFIAHRLSTLKKCDRMLVYKEGRIVESGTFEELMNQKGYAARLYEKQFRMRA